MSWSEDPFVSSSDDNDSDDPFAEPEFPGPGPAADSEPEGLPADATDGIRGRDRFVSDPFGGGPGGGAAGDPFGTETGGGAAGDPFGTETGGRRDTSSPDGPGEAAVQFDHDSGPRIESTPSTRPRQRTARPPAGATPWSRRWPWLVGAVLLTAMLVAGTRISSWRDDDGPRIAQTDPQVDAPDEHARSSGEPVVDSQASSEAGPNGSPPNSTSVSATDSPATGAAAEGGEPTATAPRGCDEQSGLDPHGLISFGPGLDRLSFCGEETWQVFVCAARESGWSGRVTYIDEVLGEAAAWFDWASGQQYDIDFSAGDDTSVVSGDNASFEDCFKKIRATDWSESRSGAVVLLDEAALDPFQNYAGIGTCGYISEADSGVFGDSRRMVAIAVHAPGEQAAIAVHELGHAQCWPHSYSGKTESEYDNPLDVVSSDAWPVGTLAVNRYASGWIHPEQVRVHRGSTAQYDLSACCGGGVQMLALLPADASGQEAGLHRRWWHLEVRDPRDRWESGLAAAGVGERVGVSVHWIENSSGVDYERRQAQVGDETGSLGNVAVVFGSLSVAGAEFCLHSDIPTSFADCEADHEWRIEVAASQRGDLNLTVSPGS